jgi:hypothetical protein
MIIKTINIALGVLVTLSVLVAAVMFTAFVWHVAVMGSTAVYHLMNS